MGHVNVLFYGKPGFQKKEILKYVPLPLLSGTPKRLSRWNSASSTHQKLYAATHYLVLSQCNIISVEVIHT